MIEERFKEAIDAYVKDGRPMGGFVTAVLENNLMLAIGKADEDAYHNLREIVKYLYNDAPSSCWGSPEKVKAWYAKKNVVPYE